jgi:uncharacterized protein YggE
MTVITFDMSAYNRIYVESVEDLNKRVADLREKLHGADIDPEQLKTSRFSVDAHYRQIKEKSVFSGWVARQNLRLELPVEPEPLNRAFEAMTTGKAQAEFHIRFEVRDKAAVREAVLAEATRTARRNAEAIASTAGCRLGKVLSMEYGWSEIHFSSMDYSMASGPEETPLAAPYLEPEDVEAQDSVTVVWELLEG